MTAAGLRAPSAGLLLAGGLIGICLGGVALLGDLSRSVPTFLVLFGVATICYLWAAHNADRWSTGSILVLGLIFRLILLPTAPSLSDDVYRYVWDGRVQAAGINPYLYAPDAAELAHLRDDRIHPRINHPHIPTVYPPAAQLLFLVCGLVSESVLFYKLVFVLLDLSAAWSIRAVLRRRGLPAGRILLYLWNPLLVVEIAGSGHVDILGVALLSASLAAVTSGSRSKAILALALSFLAKLLPVALLPSWWAWACARRAQASEPRRRPSLGVLRVLWPVGLFLGLVALAYGPFVSAGRSLFTGLTAYARHWEFNGLGYSVVKWLLGDSGQVARWVSAAGLSAAALCVAVFRVHPLRAGFLLVGTIIWLIPTLHPWYVLWVLPFAVVWRSWPWMAFTGLTALSYVVLSGYVQTGIWQEPWWLWPAQAGGFGLVWVWGRVWDRRNPTGAAEA